MNIPANPGLRKRLLELGLGVEIRIDADGITTTQTPDDVAAQAVIDAYTADEEIAYLRAQIDAHAAALRDRVVAGISAGEMASWAIKRAEAAAFGVSGNAADAPLLSAEATARGVSLIDIVTRVTANAGALGALEATIGGNAGRHKDAVRALTTLEALLAYDWHSGWPEV
jgi:hypothetical protein